MGEKNEIRKDSTQRMRVGVDWFQTVQETHKSELILVSLRIAQKMQNISTIGL